MIFDEVIRTKSRYCWFWGFIFRLCFWGATLRGPPHTRLRQIQLHVLSFRAQVSTRNHVVSDPFWCGRLDAVQRERDVNTSQKMGHIIYRRAASSISLAAPTLRSMLRILRLFIGLKRMLGKPGAACQGRCRGKSSLRGKFILVTLGASGVRRQVEQVWAIVGALRIHFLQKQLI